MIAVTMPAHQSSSDRGAGGVVSRTFRYSWQFIVHPRRAVDAVARDPQGMWTGLWLGILFLAAYAVTVLIYYLLGHQPVAEPFLTVPLEHWYLVQTFTTLPVGMAAFLSQYWSTEFPGVVGSSMTRA